MTDNLKQQASEILKTFEVKRHKSRASPYKRNGSLILDQINDLLKPLDRKQGQLEAAYGFGTLEAAASDEIRKRFQLAQVSLHHAIEEKDVGLIQKKINNLILGWGILEENAIKKGIPQVEDLDPEMWHHRAPGGQRFIFVRSQDHMKRIPRESKKLETRILTLDEICLMISWWDENEGKEVNQIKKEFPNAELVSIEKRDPNE